MTLSPPILLLLAVVGSGCASQMQLASDVQAAATGEHMSKVVACWEKAFEANGFVGEYLVTVDFQVASNGDISGARITKASDITAGEPSPLADGGSFTDCLESALNDTNLSDGGLTGPLTVTGYRIAFSDPSRQSRQQTADSSPSMLVGPRADRCQGLYSHDPPREVGLLHKLLTEARGEAELHEKDRHKRARAYQRGYDLAIELHERLKREAKQRDLPKAAKKRILDERDRVVEIREQLGTLIGCRQ